MIVTTLLVVLIIALLFISGALVRIGNILQQKPVNSITIIDGNISHTDDHAKVFKQVEEEPCAKS